jgi:WD40 repeat protein
MKCGGQVRGVALNYDASLIVSGSSDGKVTMWDGKAGKQLDSQSHNKTSVNVVAFLVGIPQGLVVSGGEDGTLMQWTWNQGKLTFPRPLKRSRRSNDTKDDDRLNVHHQKAWPREKGFTGGDLDDERGVTSLSFAFPQLVSSGGGIVSEWEVSFDKDAKQVKFNVSGGPWRGFSVHSHDEKWLLSTFDETVKHHLTTSQNGKRLSFDIPAAKNGTKISPLAQIGLAAFSPDSKRFVVQHSEESTYLKTDDPRWPKGIYWPYQASFLKFFDVETRKEIGAVKLDLKISEIVTSVVFNSDGRRVACAIADTKDFKRVPTSGRVLVIAPFADSNPLDLKYVSDFEWVWDDRKSGAIFDGVVYKPVVPSGYSTLAHIVLGPKDPPNVASSVNRVALVAKAAPVQGAPPLLAPPSDYTFLGDTSKNRGTNNMAWWRPVPPPGYRSLGDVFTKDSATRPDATIMCVRSDLCVPAKIGKFLYADWNSGGKHPFSVWEVTPIWGKPNVNARGLNVSAVKVVAGYTQFDSDDAGSGDDKDWKTAAATRAGPLYTLAAIASGNAVTPQSGFSKEEVIQIIEDYGPVQNFHPKESFFMTHVDLNEWTDRVKAGVDVWNKDANYLDLSGRDQLMPGNLNKAKTYVFVKRVHSNFTDLQFWFFYAFNGPTFAAVEAWTPVKNIDLRFDNLSYGRHIGDWCHITLRVQNPANGAKPKPVAVGYTAHGDTVWYKPIFMGSTNHIKVFSCLHEHGSYPFTGENFEPLRWYGSGSNLWQAKLYGRNPTAEGGKQLNLYEKGRYEIVQSDSFSVPQPRWLKEYSDPSWMWGPPLNNADSLKSLGFDVTKNPLALVYDQLSAETQEKVRGGLTDKGDGPRTASYLSE